MSPVLTFLRAAQNRGFLLDAFVFAMNVSVMTVLSRLFLEVIRRASGNDQGAAYLLGAMATALFVLAPVGATLKRWHAHSGRKGDGPDLERDPMASCLFNPIFYFCLTALIFASIQAFILQTLYGRQEPPGGVFVGSILLGIVLMILHTALVYRYFAPPKAQPRNRFLRSPTSAFLGDVCLFLNMLLFQLVWNLLSLADVPSPTGVFDFVFRFLILCFLALLLYFPPRMFYLADDVGKGRTWAMIFLANAPILVRVLFGGGSFGFW